MAVSWPLAWPCRGQGRPCHRLQAVVSQPPLACPGLCRAPTPCHAARLPSAPSRAPRLSYRGPSGRVVGAGCVPARPYRRPCSVPGWPCRGLSRDMVQPHAPQPQSRYTPVYRDTSSCSQTAALVTIQILYRETASSHSSVTIQELYFNTILSPSSLQPAIQCLYCSTP